MTKKVSSAAAQSGEQDEAIKLRWPTTMEWAMYSMVIGLFIAMFAMMSAILNTRADELDAIITDYQTSNLTDNHAPEQ